MVDNAVRCLSIALFDNLSRRYSRSRYEFVRNRAYFWTFFAVLNFRDAGPQQYCTHTVIPALLGMRGPSIVPIPALQHVTRKSFERLFSLAPKLLQQIR